MNEAPPSAYLDTNIVSAIHRADIKEPEVAALDELLMRRKDGVVSFTTSSRTHEEIQAAPEEHRRQHERIYALLDDVPAQPERTASLPLLLHTEEDTRLRRLSELLPDRNDARHLFQAIGAGCDYFVTADEKTIINKRAAVEAEFPVLIRLPSELLADLGG